MRLKEDTNRINGINLNVLNETVNAVKNDPELGKCKFRARNKWLDATRNCTTVKGFYATKQEIAHQKEFQMYADEPDILAGDDSGANPVEHLLNALASCVTTSIVAHAAVRNIHIEELETELEGDIDLRGFLGLALDVPKGYTNIRMKYKVKTDLENLEKLRTLAEFSPVYNTILNGSSVDISFELK